MHHYYKITFKQFAMVVPKNLLAATVETIHEKGYLIDSVVPTERTKRLLATPNP